MKGLFVWLKGWSVKAAGSVIKGWSVTVGSRESGWQEKGWSASVSKSGQSGVRAVVTGKRG